MATAQVPTFTLNNGQTMPAFGLGTWLSDKGKVGESVKVAIDCGYRHIDTAWAYGNEAEIGEAVKAKIEEGKVKRDELFITTKLWNDRHRPDLVEEALRESLQRLGLDYVNLYLMHWPFGVMAPDEGGSRDAEGKWRFSDVDYLDTWKAMEDLVDKGLTRSIGVSNFNSEQLGRVLSMEGLRYKPAINQVEIHPYLNNDQLIAYCKERGVTVTAYAPLGCTHHPRAKPDQPRIFDEPSVQEIGKKYGKTAAQVALRWGLQRETIIIPKSVTPSRIQENIQIFDFELTQDDMKGVSALNRNYRSCEFETSAGHKYWPFKVPF